MRSAKQNQDCEAGLHISKRYGTAVLSAEYVLKQKHGADAAKKIEEFEERFKAADKGSVMCSDLRGKVPGSCRACVTDAAKILEEMIEA